jgi:streptogramin lyase
MNRNTWMLDVARHYLAGLMNSNSVGLNPNSGQRQRGWLKLPLLAGGLSVLLAEYMRLTTKIILLFVITLLLAVVPAQAQWANNQAAVSVIGQPDFSSNNPGTTATTLSFPAGVAVDPTSGKVFVVDSYNSRVLRYSSAAAKLNGQAAEAVLGQPNFTTFGSATSQSGFNNPGSVFVDGAGRLWVSDPINNRVLRFDNAATKANGANADGVLGQPNFTSQVAATTQSGFHNPGGIFVDMAGRLWVTEAVSNRVLRFDNAATKGNGANADGVLGQPNFTSQVRNTTQSGMDSPRVVFVDGMGSLWVSDGNNHRVLRFDNAATKANGANADGVLGQPNFTSRGGATTQNGMNGPTGVFGDPDGRLYVSDLFNHRVLIFNSAAAKSNGANADNVLGQPDFTSDTENNGGLSATSLSAPTILFFDPATYSLYVSEAYNNRVKRYVTALPPPTPNIGPGNLPLAASSVSAQKAGSVLVYNLYDSSAANANVQNTRLNITNTHSTLGTAVHLFFIDGSSCTVADSYICLTPNQTASFLASDVDPDTKGYVVAVATDFSGCPRDFNYLIGDEYVKLSSGHAANLGAEAFAALAGGLPFCDANSTTAVLNFDGVSYNMAPRTLALDNVASRADGNDTLLVLNRFGGNLATGAATLGAIFGLLYDDAEQGLSFSVNGGCQLRGSLSGNFFRTTPRFETFIPAGRSGWLKFYSQNDIGILGAAINFNGNVGTQSNAFNQGHNLHKLSLTPAVVLTIPVFPPSC